jgi:hypothetical protein
MIIRVNPAKAKVKEIKEVRESKYDTFSEEDSMSSRESIFTVLNTKKTSSSWSGRRTEKEQLCLSLSRLGDLSG